MLRLNFYRPWRPRMNERLQADTVPQSHTAEAEFSCSEEIDEIEDALTEHDPVQTESQDSVAPSASDSDSDIEPPRSATSEADGGKLRWIEQLFAP